MGTSLSPLPDLLYLFINTSRVPVISGFKYSPFDRMLGSTVLLAPRCLFVFVELARTVYVSVAQGVQRNAIAIIALEGSVQVAWC